MWTPVQKMDWLGLTWDTAHGTLQVTDQRVSDNLSCIENVITMLPYITARKLASFVGKIISTMPVTRHIAQLRTRFTCMIIAATVASTGIRSLIYVNTVESLKSYFSGENI